MSGSGILLLFLVSSSIFLLLGLALVLYVMQYQKRMMQQGQAMQAAEVRHQETLLSASIDSQEAERSRIACTLHDGLGPSLASIRLRLLMHGQEHPNQQLFLEDLSELISENIQQLREISHDLLPGVLKSYGLQAALKELLQQVDQSTSTNTLLNTTGEAIQLSETQELAIYRIHQELVNNTLKHAKASRIELRIAWEATQLTLLYQDNGIGFELEKQHVGLGQYSMESRARALGGNLELTSQPGQGMQCQLQVPFSKSNPDPS
ncbi:MAG: sensor histidine kinase [Salibacteraceae bacterium]